jgi:OmpA-OmpF porin, OOP family
MKRLTLITVVAITLLPITGANAAQNDSVKYYYNEKSDKADIVVRVGDVDNLGFGWPEGFDPFCGNNTSVHDFPWQVDPKDPPGTDHIMVISSYAKQGSWDGYAETTTRPDNLPVAIVLKYPKPKIVVKKVVLQLMVDDFQAPVWKSSFQFHINGKRLHYVEDILNQLQQTGPIGKLVQLQVLPEDNVLFTTGKVTINIDDPITGAGDGFAIDFIQVLINPKGDYLCIGTIKGFVKNEEGKPLDQALVSANGLKESVTTSDGRFTLKGVPTGIIVLSGSNETYTTESVNFELQRDETKEVDIILRKKPAESADLVADELKTKGFINLYGIYFDSNKDIPKSESEATLRELANYLKNNPGIALEIVGHTDSDGDEKSNQNLSERRARSVINWLKKDSINVDNLKPIGMGESSPVASNATESGKALNRRVELRMAGSGSQRNNQ